MLHPIMRLFANSHFQQIMVIDGLEIRSDSRSGDSNSKTNYESDIVRVIEGVHLIALISFKVGTSFCSLPVAIHCSILVSYPLGRPDRFNMKSNREF